MFLSDTSTSAGTEQQNGYMVIAQATTLQIYKATAGAYTLLASVATAPTPTTAADNHLIVVAQKVGTSTRIDAIYGGVLCTYTDSSSNRTAGYFGIRSVGDTIALRDWNFRQSPADAVALLGSNAAFNVDPTIGSGLDRVLDGTTYARVKGSALSSGIVNLPTGVTGDLPYANTSAEYQGNYDSSGNLKKSSSLNSNVPSLTPFTTTAVAHFYSPSASTYIQFYMDDGTAGVSPTFYMPDGTTFTAPALSGSTFTSVAVSSFPTTATSGANGIEFTGLTASTPYYFLAYYSRSSGLWTVVINNTGFPESDVIDAYADGYAVFMGSAATTSFSTGGGGGVGAGCPEINQLIERRRHGVIKYVPAHRLREGDCLRDPIDGQWNRINRPVIIDNAIIWEARIAWEVVRVDASHLFMDASDKWVNVKDLKVGQKMHVYPAGIGEVNSVREVGPGQFVHISCERMRYVLGRTCSHNVKVK